MIFTFNSKHFIGFNKRLFIYLILSLCLISFINGDRIKSKIYKPIESKHFCFRRMNATNQIGCNTKENGNVGVVYLINNDVDMTHVLSTGRHSPYIPVITPKYFNLKSMNRLKESSDRISGVLIIDFDERNRTSEVNFLSPDKSCPNKYFDLMVNHSNRVEWNTEDGSPNEGLMFNDWPFPIFFIKNQTNIDEIKDCFNRFGGPDWPLCAVELEAPMNGAKDSITCIRRTAFSRNSYSLSQTLFCDPLGGYNIINTLFETSKNQNITNNSLVVISARLDSFSMFDNISPGADSALTSVVALLAVADTLNKLKAEIKAKTDKNVLFALFDGEAFDYIGSSRVVYDMSAGRFPVDSGSSIDLAQIRSHHFSHFIELNQLASHKTSDKHRLWIHKNVGTQANERIKQLEQILINNTQNITNLEIDRIPEEQPLPPASLQTFLKNDASITGVVITNHEKEYSNKFYNSFYDDFINVNQSERQIHKILADISTVISKSIYQLLTNQTMDSIQSNETLIEELLECYLHNPVCTLFKYVAPDTSFHTQTMEPLPTYVGVYRSTSLSSTSRAFTYMLLSYLTGEQMNKTKSECTQLNKESQSYSYYWMSNTTVDGVCVRSQAIKLEAVSPAFDNYVSDGTVNNYELYSSWTESQWKGVTARMFVMPSPLQQWLTLITGVVVLLLSFLVVYFLDLKSSLLFSGNEDIVPQTTGHSIGC